MAPPVVPYDGIPEGMVCLAVKRALSRAGYMQWGNFTLQWGEFAQRACANFQHDHKLKPTGVYTQATHNVLVATPRAHTIPKEWAFDAFSIKIMKNEHTTPDEEIRQKILDGVTWSIDHQSMIGYDMFRPFYLFKTFPVYKYFKNDCSGMFAQWYKWGSAPDPHHARYNGSGNTATLWEYGDPVSSLKEAELCDAVLYGKPWQSGSAAHVAILRRKVGSNWFAGSHGRESGPNEVEATYRRVIGIRRFPLRG
jgi:Putative peptidoglycan binding domain